MKKWLIGGGLLVVGSLVAFGFIASGKPKGTDVFVHLVKTGAIRSEVTGTGEIQARTRVNVGAQIPGTIIAIPVKEGEEVKKGQLLLQIDPERYRQEVQRLEAELRMTRVSVAQERNRLSTLKARYDRTQQLKAQGLVSEDSYDQTKLDYDASRFQLESLEETVSQTEAALGKSRDDLSKTTIFSPIDGRVTALNTEVGEQVIVGTTNIPGSVMLVVSDMSELLAEVDVDESQIAKVIVGQTVNVKIDAIDDVTYAGRVAEIRNSARKKGEANVFGVKVLLTAPDNRLRPGMTAKARVEIETRPAALRVPIQSVIERAESALGSPTGGEPGEKRVDTVILMHEGKAKAVRVQTGLTDDDFVEVLAGVREGDTVVTGPYRTLRKLKDGEAVLEKKEGEDDDKTNDNGGASVEVS